MRGDYVQIVFTVSEADLPPVLQAMGAAGAGVLGEYTFCSFSVDGTGRFVPSDGARPHVGDVGTLNAEAEARVETFCERGKARAVVAAIRKAHPYEEPVIYVIPLLNEDDL
ncbi:MAG: hypothetical protein AAF125_13145 [Chloroflexota bacterium]